MLKCIIFIFAIYVFGTFNNLKVHGALFDHFRDKFVEGKKAEDLFINDIAERLQYIADKEKKVAEAKANLSFVKTGKKLIPSGTGVVSVVVNGIKKWAQIFWDMLNISKRNYNQLQLILAKREYKKEKLLDNWSWGVTICEKAFENDYFKKYKKWVLVKNHPKTKKKKKIWIRVQTAHQTETKKLWRTSKRCMAKLEKTADGEPNKPFPVYIAAAIDYDKSPAHKVYVFRRTPWKERDYFNKWIFFWQHVVYVDAYLD